MANSENSTEYRESDKITNLQASLAWYKKRDEIVSRLIGRFRATPDLPSIFQSIVNEIGQTMMAESCIITLDDEMGTQPSIFEYSSPAYTESHYKTATVAAPIMLQHELVGTITVVDQPERTWTVEEVNFVNTIARELAFILANNRLAVENQRQLRALSAQLVTILEDERQRFARELHDEAGQLLIGIKLNLRVLAQQIPETLPALRDDVDRLRQEVNQATERLQALARGLRPPTLDELGLETALERLTAEFKKNSGVAVQLEVDISPSRWDEPTEIACYRIVQEALTNVARHAQAAQIWISLTQKTNNISLELRDDGRGFAPDQIPSTGLGLLGMRERANMLGGKFALHSSPGHGTHIQVELPVNANYETSH